MTLSLYELFIKKMELFKKRIVNKNFDVQNTRISKTGNTRDVSNKRYFGVWVQYFGTNIQVDVHFKQKESSLFTNSEILLPDLPAKGSTSLTKASNFIHAHPFSF